jgi:predicted ATPase/DNA-binding XRE family transcriptional regulator
VSHRAVGSFAEQLRHFREARGLTQEELAERAGLTVKGVGALERAERTRPYPHTVRSLADALHLDEQERERLIASVPPRADTGVTPAASITGPSHGAPSSVLVGREAEVEHVCTLLGKEGHRLVTITGPGGVGKTRVALEVLARESTRFVGGGVFVDLAALSEPSLLLQRVAAALGIPEAVSVDRVVGLVPALAGRRLLLVLDNLEHLLAAAPTVADLVAHSPDLVVLATSRAALRVRAEHEVVLAPLPVPETDTLESVLASPAAQLFLDRTTAAGARVELDAGSAPTLAAICRRLDGLPLAVELAAAGARLLTPAAMLARLDGRRLGPGPRDLSERQRTMTAALDWSLALLEPEAVSLFDRLATFTGGFSLEAAEEVLGGSADVLAALGTLVEHSLVTRTPSPDEQPRFRLLEPVRQYAVHRTVPDAGDADRHARYFHGRSMVAARELHGPDLARELNRLESDHANLRSAYLRLLEVDRLADAAEMAGGLWLYLGLRGHAREGLTWLDRLDPGASDASRCRALTGRLGLQLVTGDIAGMRADAGKAVTLARRVDDELGAETLALAGHAAVFVGDLDGARRLLDDALARAESVTAPWELAHVLVARGQLALALGDLDEAEQVLSRALDVARALGNPFTLATALTRRSTVTALRDDDVATAAMLGESIEISVEARMSWTLSYSLPALAGVAVRLGEAETAVELFGASASLSATYAVDARFPVARELADRALEVARHRLDDDVFRGAWDAGRAATPHEVAELARRLTRLARQ